MAASTPNRKPTFFWQGLLIILPVAIVSSIGLVALRRDRAVIEEEARRGASQLVDQLAADLARRLPLKLAAYDRFSELWLKHQSAVSIASRIPPADEDYTVQKEEWQAANPGLDPEAVLPNRFGCSLQGAPGWPQDYDDPPQAPPWLIEMAGQQRQAWDSLRAADLSDQSAGNLQAKVQDFLDTRPPQEACVNAEFLSLRQGLSRRTTLDAFSELQWFSGKCQGFRSESGLPMFALIAAEALRAARQGGATNNILTVDLDDRFGYFGAVIGWALDEPSILTPALIEQLQTLVGSTSEQLAQFQPAIHAAREKWQAQQRFHEMSQIIQRRGLLRGATGTNFWIHYESRLWFCRAIPGRIASPQSGDGERISWTTNQITWVRAYPKEVVDNAVAQLIRELGPSIPDYVGLELRIENEPIGLARKQSLSLKALPVAALPPNPYRRHAQTSGKFYLQATANDRNDQAPSASVLAEAQAGFVPLPVAWSTEDVIGNGPGTLTIAEEPSRSAHFKLQVRLVNPELLFALQRQRSWVFGGLIVASTFAACVGLAAAYRSFRRQLRLNELKSNFVSSVSHELRAPIASVRLMAESLERGKIADSTKQHEYFKFIVQECRRLSSLIENVLDFSQIEQGRKQFEFEPTDMRALTEQTVKLMHAYANERQVALVLAIANTTAANFQLTADGKALQQALVNLIDNAIKHSQKGQTVTVGLEVTKAERDPTSADSEKGPALFLWVEDNGEGIPAEEHEKIFERFYRLGSELRRQTEGVGIGLSIVKHVVAAHGGKVHVRSAVGQGSRFTIELPNARRGD